MDYSKSNMAEQIAQAAIAFEQRRTGNHVPKSVTVVLSEGTLVITRGRSPSRAHEPCFHRFGSYNSNTAERFGLAV